MSRSRCDSEAEKGSRRFKQIRLYVDLAPRHRPPTEIEESSSLLANPSTLPVQSSTAERWSFPGW